MTLPASGPLVLGLTGGGNSIDGEFGYGGNLQSYLGVYYGRSGQAFQFPKPGNSIAMGLFYSAFKITGGSKTFNSTQPFTIPVYNTITITVTGDQGGQAGYYGVLNCGGTPTPTPSGIGGSSGVVTPFGGYLGAGSGSGGGGSGGYGSYGPTYTQSYTNPVQGGNGPPSGTLLNVTIGPGGPGGSGGDNYALVYNFLTKQYQCTKIGNATNGSQGANGVVTVTWA